MLPPLRTGRGKAGGKRAGDANPVGDPLFDTLRACRRDLAKAAGVPPYVVFHDSTLREMARLRPRSMAELGGITGVGAAKRASYGQAFLDAILAFGESASVPV